MPFLAILELHVLLRGAYANDDVTSMQLTDIREK